MSKLKLDLHDIFNKGKRIEDELNKIIDDAVEGGADAVKFNVDVNILKEINNKTKNESINNQAINSLYSTAEKCFEISVFIFFFRMYTIGLFMILMNISLTTTSVIKDKLHKSYIDISKRFYLSKDISLHSCFFNSNNLKL